MSEEWTEITACWKGNLTFVGQNKAGGTVQMGVLKERPGISPMQLLLLALAGCTGMDIVSILLKKRAKLADMQVRVRSLRADNYPMIWTNILITYLVWGEGIRPKDVEHAIQLSEEKYCSVGIMLGKSAKIISDYQILEPGENAI